MSEQRREELTTAYKMITKTIPDFNEKKQSYIRKPEKLEILSSKVRNPQVILLDKKIHIFITDDPSSRISTLR